MIRTNLLQAPVITLLSSSTAASTKAAAKLCALGGMDHIRPPQSSTESMIDSSSSSSSSSSSLSIVSNDSLDQAWNKPFFLKGGSEGWTSVAIRCSRSGTILHFLAEGKENKSNHQNEKGQTRQHLQLLAITDYDDDEDAIKAIVDARDLLASQMLQYVGTANRILRQFKTIVLGTLQASDILGSNGKGSLPLLSFPQEAPASTQAAVGEPKELDTASSFLKEVVVPTFDYASYDDGSTLLSRLGACSMMTRLVAGVYQWPKSLTCIRPLPTAAEDRRLPPPSLIFHCEVPSAVAAAAQEEHDVQTARIGYGGLGDGQIMLHHPDLLGLDVRYCPQPTVTSAFSEAQDSLLAGSMDELQNANTLVAGKGEAQDDERIGKGDCWVEVRANLKKPQGYIRLAGNGATAFSRSKKQRVAKIPDLPYE